MRICTFDEVRREVLHGIAVVSPLSLRESEGQASGSAELMAETRPSAGIARNCTQYGHRPVLHAIARTTAISRYCTQSDAIRSSAGIARNWTQYGRSVPSV
jgi:hypothetical protein